MKETSAQGVRDENSGNNVTFEKSNVNLDNLDFNETKPKTNSAQNQNNPSPEKAYQEDSPPTPSNNNSLRDFSPAPVPITQVRIKRSTEPPLPGQKAVGNTGF